MKILVNGDPVDVPSGVTVADLVERVAPQRSPRGVAVAVNGEVVSRSEWEDSSLSEDDLVEVLAAIGGG